MKIGCDPEFVVRDPKGDPVPAHLFFPPKEEKIEVIGSAVYTPGAPLGSAIIGEVGGPATQPTPTKLQQARDAFGRFTTGVKQVVEGEDPSPGNKLTPVKGNFAGYFRDGFNLEINANPQMCIAQVQECAKGVLRMARKRLPKGYKIDAVSAVRVDPTVVSGPDAPEDVKVFGCHPAMNAYTEQASIPDIDAVSHPFRYAGGHIHFSEGKAGVGKATLKWTGPFNDIPVYEYPPDVQPGDYDPYATANMDWLWDASNHPLAVKMLDLKVGLPLTVLQKDLAEVFLRRRFYGRAGEFRTQIYPAVLADKDSFGRPLTEGSRPRVICAKAMGIEYRVPGAETWRHNAIVAIAARCGRYTLQNFKNLSATWDKAIEDDLQLAINEGKDCEKLLEKFDPEMLETMQALRKVKDVSTFQYPDLDFDAHKGFVEMAAGWGVPIPRKSGITI